MGVHITANCLQQWPPKTCQRNASLLPMASSTPSSTSCSSVSSLRMATPVWRFARHLRAMRLSSVPRAHRMFSARRAVAFASSPLLCRRGSTSPLDPSSSTPRRFCAVAQAESLRYKLLGGLAVRRACYGVLRFIMESGALGCEVIVSGKLRAQRAKSMKFEDGYMIKAGNPCREYIDKAVRHVLLRQGVLGIKVNIMLPFDPAGK